MPFQKWAAKELEHFTYFKCGIPNLYNPPDYAFEKLTKGMKKRVYEYKLEYIEDYEEIEFFLVFSLTHVARVTITYNEYVLEPHFDFTGTSIREELVEEENRYYDQFFI